MIRPNRSLWLLPVLLAASLSVPVSAQAPDGEAPLSPSPLELVSLFYPEAGPDAFPDGTEVEPCFTCVTDDWLAAAKAGAPVPLTQPIVEFLQGQRDADWEDPHFLCLDFDLAAAGQDYLITGFSLESVPTGPGTETVVATFENFGEAIRTEYRFIQQDGIWKLAEVDLGWGTLGGLIEACYARSDDPGSASAGAPSSPVLEFAQ